MINIYVYGLDQFLVGDLSKEVTKNLAELMEVSEDDINFVAPNDMIFHKGVEQTSWRVIIEVKLPDAYTKIQNKIRDLLIHYVSQVAVHVEITFVYYFASEHYLQINQKYPLYLDEEEDMEEDIYSEEMKEGEGEDEIYTGDIFEGVLDNEDDPSKRGH